jgi:hypothetical protein
VIFAQVQLVRFLARQLGNVKRRWFLTLLTFHGTVRWCGSFAPSRVTAGLGDSLAGVQRATMNNANLFAGNI